MLDLVLILCLLPPSYFPHELLKLSLVEVVQLALGTYAVCVTAADQANNASAAVAFLNWRLFFSLVFVEKEKLLSVFFLNRRIHVGALLTSEGFRSRCLLDLV